MNEFFQSTLNTRAILPHSFRFVRSDVPAIITDEEKARLISWQITTVIDLREADECLAKPCPLEQDSRFLYYHMPVTGGSKIPESTEQTPLSYITMADEKMNIIIERIINAQSNVLYFCNAGKDRTGVVSALLLKRLGMPDDYIINDYLLSKDNLNAMLQKFAADNPTVDIKIITPQREYMEKFLDSLK